MNVESPDFSFLDSIIGADVRVVELVEQQLADDLESAGLVQTAVDELTGSTIVAITTDGFRAWRNAIDPDFGIQGAHILDKHRQE